MQAPRIKFLMEVFVPTDESRKRIQELRLAEMGLREQIVEQLRVVLSRKLWLGFGYKSFQAFCEKELCYSREEIRPVLVALGLIVTKEQLRSNDPAIQMRIENLKAWRRDRAKTNGIAAFKVFSNRTLLQLAEQGPHTSDELLRVSGMGPQKTRSFGSEVLQLLSLSDPLHLSFSTNPQKQ